MTGARNIYNPRTGMALACSGGRASPAIDTPRARGSARAVTSEPHASACGDGGLGASEERSARSARAPHGPPESIGRTQPFSLEPFPLELSRGPPEATLALLEEVERLQVLTLAEVGPQRVRDVDLGVGELPEEEVAESHLAARPDEEIGIGNTGGGKVPGHRARGDVVGLQLTTAHPPRDGPRGPRDLFPAAVADGQDDRHAGVPLGRLDGRPERLADRSEEHTSELQS